MNKLLSVIQPMFGNNPKFYAMSCPNCGWIATLELLPCEVDVITLTDDSPKGLQSVTKLPKKCPKCGGCLKKKKLPVNVCN